jgi:hypothetical protein
MNSQEQVSISELVQRLSEQTSELARKEVELAKAEVTEKGKKLGVGAGAFGAAGIAGLFALAALTAAAILLLATAVADWLAALIVATIYALAAGGLALAGRKQVEEGSPPVPERAIESTKRDIDAAKAGVKEGRHA